MLSYKMDFSSCDIMPGFGKSSHIYPRKFQISDDPRNFISSKIIRSTVVVTQARVLCLICMYARSPRTYISGKARVPVLQLICYTSGTLKICLNLTLIFPSAYIVTDSDYDCGS